MNEQKNIFAFMAVMVVSIFLWQYFLPPKPEGQQNKKGNEAATIVQAEVKDTSADQADEEGASPRLNFATDKTVGSLRLRGGLIDQLTLKHYRATAARDSSPIQLLHPREDKYSYFIAPGWISTQKDLKLPTQNSLWTAAHPGSKDKPIVLTYDNKQGVTFTTTIAMDKEYLFTVTQTVKNTSAKAIELTPTSSVQRRNANEIKGEMILHEGPIGYIGGKLQELKYGDLENTAGQTFQGTGGWVGMTDKYWLAALIAPQQSHNQFDLKVATTTKGPLYQSGFIGQPLQLAPNQEGSVTYHVFAGPKIVELLDHYEKEIGVQHFDLAVDFGWFYIITKPLFYLLDYLQGIVGSFGLAILLLTVIIKVAFFPLANKSYRSMAKMRLLQPKIEALKARYGNDKMRMNQELMNLYKKEKVSPVSGCLPLLLQMPILFALYKVIYINIEMRHAPFFGWINDLSAPDPTNIFNLFGLLPFTPPELLHVGVWPMLMGGSMWLQQRLSPTPTDPNQAMMMWMMPILLTFMLAQFPAGLVIYWTWSNLLSIVQQWYMTRQVQTTAK